MVIALLVLAVLVLSCIKIVPEATACVVEFLGSYQSTWDRGVHFKIPVLQRIAKKVSLKEHVHDFPPQSVITKDNVTMEIDTVVYCRIVNPQLYAYGAENPIAALENLTATTLRNIIGELELDQTLTSRDTINVQMRQILDEATDPWGLRVNRVELKNITPPAQIRASMEKQMKAERERRESLLTAEGERAAAVTRAAGNKEAMILNAEAERDAAIARARGEAEAKRLVAEAEAEAIKLLNDAGMTDQVLALRRIEAMVAMSAGESNKFFIPTDMLHEVGKTVPVGAGFQLGEEFSATH